MIHAIYNRVRKMIRREIVITLTKDSLGITTDGRLQRIHLSEIRDLTLKRMDGSNYLVIVTDKIAEMIDTSRISQAPDQLIKSIYHYKLQEEKTWINKMLKVRLSSLAGQMRH